LAITPDAKTLYVVDSDDRAGGNRKIWAFDVRPDGTLALTGDLTIRDVTKRIAIPVKVRPGYQEGGAAAPTFETTFEIDRTDFGLNGSPKWSGMNVSIAKNVEIHIAIGGVPAPRPRP
jgi:hypothetical protein